MSTHQIFPKYHVHNVSQIWPRPGVLFHFLSFLSYSPPTLSQTHSQFHAVVSSRAHGTLSIYPAHLPSLPKICKTLRQPTITRRHGDWKSPDQVICERRAPSNHTGLKLWNMRKGKSTRLPRSVSLSHRQTQSPGTAPQLRALQCR